jgi:D-alanyl-lipoteichoic acid acyltransferase DltB (MBOAT superfamily)
VLYNSLTYLVFFAIVLAGTWALPTHRSRLGLLLAASWLFYAAWYPVYLLLLIVVTAVNYAAALAVNATVEPRPQVARRIVAATVVANLANLGFFKYANFFLDSWASVSHALLGSTWQPAGIDLFLPLGISFYTFQKIAYVVDVYRGDAPVIRNPLKMALFGAFFPQLIAGPIVRPNEFIPQLASIRRFDARLALHGLDLIAVGLVKKVLVADQVAPFVDQVFASPGSFGAGTLLFAVYAYSAQIYCDFSGYTDIGRGCAYLLGYHLPRNFEAPYFSVNLTEFWRRWHMTLSQWLRDYLYIPLGGNRRGRVRTYWNLFVTMALGGLWHGASWNFVIWGMLHGAGLAATRAVHERLGVPPSQPLRSGRAYRLASTLATFHFVAFAWVFFRAESFGSALAVIGGIARAPWFPVGDLETFGFLRLPAIGAALLGLGALHGAATLAARAGVQRSAAWRAARPFAYFAVLVACLLFANRGAQQFIYFQF